MRDKADTYCGKCIKADVCGMEGVYDPATTYCAYKVEVRPHGEWKWKMMYQGSHFRYGNVFCSECEYEAHRNVPVIRLKGALYNFCPNCGAPMTEEAFKKYNGLKEGDEK